jgi:hypothetical protein
MNRSKVGGKNLAEGLPQLQLRGLQDSLCQLHLFRLPAVCYIVEVIPFDVKKYANEYYCWFGIVYCVILFPKPSLII